MEKKMENDMETGVIISEKMEKPFRDPHNKDYSMLGSILRSPYLGKLPSCHGDHGFLRSARTRIIAARRRIT